MANENYNEISYQIPGVLSYFLCDKQEFVVGGLRLKVVVCGTGCGIGPIFLIGGGLLYIGLAPCAAIAIANCWHMEGPIRMPDYVSFSVLPDLGTLFIVKPAWKSNFLSTIGFAPIPWCGGSIVPVINPIGRTYSEDAGNLHEATGSGLPDVEVISDESKIAICNGIEW